MDTRIPAAQKSMKSKGLDFLLVTSQANVTYFTGVRNMTGVLIIPRNDAPTLLTSVTERNRAEVCEPKIRVFSVGKRPGTKPDIKAGSFFEGAKKVIGGKKWSIGYEEKSLSVFSYNSMLKNLKGKFRAASGISENLRAIKSQDEIRRLQRAAEIADEGALACRELLRIGISERELAKEAEEQMRRDADWFSFETIVASGPNGAEVHHQTGDRKIQKGDLVVVDIGAMYEGYCSDISRTFCLAPEKRQKKIYDAVLKAQQEAIKSIKAGVSAERPYFVAAKVLQDSGFALIHAIGHGIGLEIHEAPSLSHGEKEKLRPGMVFTVEPGAYSPGFGGARIEDMVLLAKERPQMLTKAAKWL